MFDLPSIALVWTVAIFIFLSGIVVGKYLFEPKIKKYLRPPIPPEPKKFYSKRNLKQWKVLLDLSPHDYDRIVNTALSNELTLVTFLYIIKPNTSIKRVLGFMLYSIKGRQQLGQLRILED